ncbi:MULTISPECIES: MBL fold metallo-hydrolase [unclassified Luteococcus]|uniref:MBL fold metallo-hydrolase n=1 Tax=unclassified Luteococcus TaxID=2639923 RepID=UPI00313DBB8D
MHPNSQARLDLASHQGLTVITLGVAAGPAIRGPENGIATAVVVDDRFYLVDFGLGCTRAAHDAGLRGANLAGMFITHLHSDHVAELPSYLLFNWGKPVNGLEASVPIIGPGPDNGRADGSLAGTRGLVDAVRRGFSYDLDIRIQDEGRPDLGQLLQVEELGQTYDSPALVFQDGHVQVLAVSVDHPPVNPAYAYRFDTAYGSVTISGDTTFCPALVELARGTDLLIHEAVNVDFYREEGFSGAFLAHQLHSHTTPADAGRVATLASAEQLVLSHLAGRAEDWWWIEQASSTYRGPVVVAKSGMTLRVQGARKTA